MNSSGVGGFQHGEDDRRGDGPAPTGRTVPEPEIAKKGPPAPPAYVEPPKDGAPKQLDDMRHVDLNHCYHDKTQGQKRAREMMRKQPVQFSRQLAALETEHRKDVAAQKAERKAERMAKREAKLHGGEGAPDEGTERCLELAEKLLLEMGEKHK